MMFNPKDYRYFKRIDEVNAWTNQHYKDWLETLQKDKFIKGSVSNCLYMHTGFGNKIHNAVLRGNNDYSDEELQEEYKIINPMVDAIQNFKIPENIVVYRYTKKNILKYLFKDQKISVGQCFSDKAILSTTLLKNELKEFAFQNHCDCVLRLFLPKDTMGVYVEFDCSCLNEYEILLPPNAVFQLMKKNFGIPWTVYDCALVE